MINKKELRVGNKVKVSNNNVFVEMIVIELHQNKCHLKFRDEDTFDLFEKSYTDIFPIQLTSEVFFEYNFLGFEDEDEKEVWHKDFSNIEDTLSLYQTDNLSEKYYCVNIGTEIQYFHTLQNINYLIDNIELQPVSTK